MKVSLFFFSLVVVSEQSVRLALASRTRRRASCHRVEFRHAAIQSWNMTEREEKLNPFLSFFCLSPCGDNENGEVEEKVHILSFILHGPRLVDERTSTTRVPCIFRSLCPRSLLLTFFASKREKEEGGKREKRKKMSYSQCIVKSLSTAPIQRERRRRRKNAQNTGR